MSWWGKLLGGGFGFMLGGPLGALFGAALGHQLDKGVNINFDERQGASADTSNELAQTAFFTATFSMLGYLAKADGRVSKEEIAYAERVMQNMSLSSEQRQAAIWLFNEGKKPSFHPDEILLQLKQQLGRRRNLMRVFIEIQVQAAFEDGVLHTAEEQVLLNSCRMLGISEMDYRAIVYMIQAMGGFEQQHGWQGRKQSKTAGSLQLADAYKILGVEKSATDSEVKKAYRRLLSQHHPDKLVSKGLPEEMMRIATEKTHQIKKAYELVKDNRSSLR
ncbi:co-chaperone DjlA [Solemya velum gill symbiont]|uniref:co-chaperone DjlA n=1 Tax=Solemya velum gill symbiont TaxID=2340 RepID=UPI00099685E0|nr:co-chaperone DjlA [Solemya velum gill symbiont]OOZ00456.1 molecular chaperone DjlA [Solemya velum gill symbiont]OOZ02581.1 molecular chaperone DjlA [Solemya velum gill symbiont]OOZ04959.1 molecular chaperone DjlA [Solemya velum gill symbiont]OOZ07199.1 molecular chaperone DjlA [Solemya velum gill symbiont]OOZ09381.1 molecular chaperone DjlA [Solemya velum gill symbiont]